MESKYYIHNINPLAIELGSFTLPWYWLVYFVGFIWTLYMVHKLNKDLQLGMSKNDIADYFQWAWPALFLGARLFYILVYNFNFFLEHPHMIVKIWLGGMSFHGALLGITLSLFLTAKWKKQNFLLIADSIATVAPLVLAFGRIGNFINGELWGKPTEMPWGFIVNGVSLHPSQLYEALLEGFILFWIIWMYSQIKRPKMAVSGLFLMGYGLFRFFIEFFFL